MGFFDFQQKSIDQELKGLSPNFLHKAQCKACPLNNQKGLAHPHMEPFGTLKPIVYILGEAPGAKEDEQGQPFVGPAGQVLRFRIPRSWDPYIRWNNCVRTRPPKNRKPEHVEIECCRPSVQGDIEKTKPRAVFGFGNVPLEWVVGDSQISRWRGKHVPVQIGTHTCWFFPMFHPSYVLRSRKYEPRSIHDYGSDIEFTFSLDLKNAFACVKDLPDPVIDTVKQASRGIDLITGSGGNKDLLRIQSLLDHMATQKRIGFDFETRGIRPYPRESKLLSVAMASQQRVGSFALSHSKSRWTGLQRSNVYELLENFLRRAKCQKVVHNLAFELEWIGEFFGADAIRAEGSWGCSRVQSFVLDERTYKGNQSLDGLCFEHFGIRLKAISNLDVAKLDEYPIETVLKYNGIDSRYHLKLYNVQSRLIKEQKLATVYRNQVRRIPTMVLTQLKGIPIDQRVVKQLHGEWSRKIKTINHQIESLPVVSKFKRQIGYTFKPSSNKDVKELLNGVLHLNVQSVDEHILDTIEHPIAKAVAELRKASKVRSTYIEPVMQGSSLIFPDGRIHPLVHTTTAITSRTSSEGPNQQNWPKHTNKEVRKQIRPKSDECVVSFDYGQIQARGVASESKDKALIKAFWDRYDIHADWALRIADAFPRWVKEGRHALKEKNILKQYRQRAKNEFVFAAFFGAQAKKLASTLGIPESVAAQLLDDFWHMFPDIHFWHEHQMKFYLKHGFVTGLSGFRRRAPCSPTEMINAPIQADESLIVCDAMARLSEIDHDQLQASMEIHDDLTFIWHKSKVDQNAEVVIREMLNVPFEWAHIVPVVVEMSVGCDWYDCQEVGVFESDRWDGKVPVCKL